MSELLLIEKLFGAPMAGRSGRVLKNVRVSASTRHVVIGTEPARAPKYGATLPSDFFGSRSVATFHDAAKLASAGRRPCAPPRFDRL